MREEKSQNAKPDDGESRLFLSVRVQYTNNDRFFEKTCIRIELKTAGKTDKNQ